MKKSAFFSDLFFAFSVGSLLFLCLLRSLRFPFVAALTLALVCGVLCAALAFIPLDKKRKKVVAEKKDAEKRDDLMLYLALLEERKCAEFFRPAFFDENAPPQIRYLGGFYALETKEDLFFPLFTVRPVDGDCATQILRVESDKRKTLLCSSTAPETDRLLSRFKVAIRKADEIYGDIKSKKILPERYPFERETVPKLKSKTKLWFSRKNARGFLTGGIMLLFLSLITPFPYYYRLFGVLSLILAVIIRFYGAR